MCDAMFSCGGVETQTWTRVGFCHTCTSWSGSVALKTRLAQQPATGSTSIHLRQCCGTLVFDIRHHIRASRRFKLIREILFLPSMLRSFVLRLSLWSARRVQQPFNTPHVWSRQRQLSAQVFAGFVRTKGHSVVHQDDAPPHVPVSEAELSRIALTKECRLPGVNFHRKDRAWRAYWQEGQKTKFAYYGIGKLEKKGMTENAASLAALRAAIATRNEKVVANAKEEKLHFDEGDLQGMVDTKKCPIPGVSYHKTMNSWQVHWSEQQKEKACSFPLNKLKAHGMTEKEASLAALRSAIDFRANKVGLKNQRNMKMIKVVDEGF